jgi:hypothetical protein
LADRYHSQIIISATVNEALPDLAAKKLGAIKTKDDQAGDLFYQLAAAN